MKTEMVWLIVAILAIALMWGLFLISTATATVDNNSDQFIVAFSSNDPAQLRAYADIYDEKASNLWQNSKSVRRNGSPIYDKYRQWAMSLNRKADMLETGEFSQ